MTTSLLSAFYIKQGDTAPDIVFLLEDAEGNAVSLTDAEVQGTLRSRGDDEAAPIDLPLDIDVPATDGRVRHTWEAGETDVAGEFDVEVRITFMDGAIQTLPSSGSAPRVVIAEHIPPVSS